MSDPHRRPVFSVVVPTRDRPHGLRALLDALDHVTHPRERFEVIISDDGGTVPLEPIVGPWRTRLPLTVVSHPNAGPATARNRGAAVARGDWLVFTDDDCRPEPDWLRALAARADEARGALIAGHIVNALPENPFSTATQLIVSCAAEHYARRPHGQRYFSTSNLAVPASRFRELGGFSQDFPLAAGEDYDFCDRWQQAGWPVELAPAAVVRHAHPLTLASFWRQHFHYGRGLLRFRDAAARRARRRLRGESPPFYLDLVTYPLRQRRRTPRRWLHAGLVVLSQAATTSGVAWELARSMRA